MYKLVCLDIDGTLLNKERKLSPLTVSVLKKIQERTPIILASSRMPSAMKYFQDEIGISDNPMVCYNGSLIIGYDNEILLSEVIPLNILEFIAKHNSVLNYNVSTYVEDEWFTSKIDYWSNREINNTRVDPKYCIPNKELIQKLNLNKKHPHKIMCMGDENEIQDLENKLQQSFKNTINLYRSKPTYLEISNGKMNKALALKLLLDDIYKFLPEETVAFGDNLNDAELLQFAGHSIAVGNASPQLIEIADEITSSNIDDGVAKSLIRIFNLNL